MNGFDNYKMVINTCSGRKRDFLKSSLIQPHTHLRIWTPFTCPHIKEVLARSPKECSKKNLRTEQVEKRNTFASVFSAKTVKSQSLPTSMIQWFCDVYTSTGNFLLYIYYSIFIAENVYFDSYPAQKFSKSLLTFKRWTIDSLG